MESQVIGRYELFDKIAAGGMATVHLGRFRGEKGFSRTVALKRLHAQLAADPSFVAMFLDEARIASRIRHPNVVSTLDVVSDGGEALLVMDYVVGDSLSGLARAARPEPVPVAIALAIMIAVLHGLHAAHEATTEQGTPLHLVHRDVSPQNILVGSDGVARVLDFGIARAAQRTHTTKAGEIKGKLSYMAPEQLSAGPLDRRSDIYGAAVVLWECLTGQRLFASDTEAGVVTKVLHHVVAPPSSLQPHLPAALDEVVARGLSRDPAVRFASAREMAIALGRCGVVPAAVSDVGEWVESLSRDALARRAERVAAIEKETDPAMAATVPLPAPTSAVPETAVPFATGTLVLPSPGRTPATPTVSDRYVTSATVPAQARAAKPSSRLAGPVALAAILLLGSAGAGAYVVHASGRALPDSAAATPPANASAAVMPAPVASAAAPPPAASDAWASSSMSVASQAPQARTAPALASPSAATARPAVPARGPALAAPTGAKKAAADCSVPYVIDAGGIRRLKPECL